MVCVFGYFGIFLLNRKNGGNSAPGVDNSKGEV